MNKILLISFLLFSGSFSQAQILKNVSEKAKKKSNNEIDKTIENTENKKNGKNDSRDTTDNKKNIQVNDTTINPGSDPNQPASFRAYSKYDFVPGEKVIGFEDFSTGNIGDFPAGWNTNASGEIVTIEGKPGRWLWLTKPGQFVPEFAKQYPEDFTFEFDLLHGVPFGGGNIIVGFAEMTDNNLDGWSLANNAFGCQLEVAVTGTESGVSRFSGRTNGSTDIQNMSNPNFLNDNYNPVHIAIWRQKERVRVYLNEEKIWDIPKATIKEAKFNSSIFSMDNFQEIGQYYISNLRLAIGAPDTRKKMLEQNKWVTHGILFDVNSDKIKAESYGTLKEMANVLKEFPDLKVKIVGHTDADGNDASNLDLSKRRAASVKIALTKEFGIAESRMETDGKGEGEPIDKNETPAGKANNRRVEFIKI
jgi:outer membrane protein OmpA-like peptidoglycan-associated protein